mmetsp:Transcript_837/g.2101  ORF Transcript_837/g.2101 Transcript_837/m.2101 type:complete len:404 (-) Transcript_837:360-1571(-)
MGLDAWLGLFNKKEKGASTSQAAPTGSASRVSGAAAGTSDGSAGRTSNTEDVSAAKRPVEAMMSLTQEGLDESINLLAKQAAVWDTSEYRFVRTLQDAVRNHGRVDLMRAKDGHYVAVKRMPCRWMRKGPQEFKEQFPNASEQPWSDLGFVHELNRRQYPYSVQLHGVFRDETHSYVVSGFAADGDLFSWCDRDPKPGPEREAVMQPLVVQMFSAVRWLHEVGIAHRDISLENILLANNSLKLIDFGMSTLSRSCVREVRGKQSYQAPEMHLDAPYDSFLVDTFALGVVVFAMAAQDYPWIATKRNSCQLFEYVNSVGLKRFMERRKLRKGNGAYLSEVFSPPLFELFDGLLSLNAKTRMALGESCWASEETVKRGSVWNLKWLQGVPVPPGGLGPDGRLVAP